MGRPARPQRRGAPAALVRSLLGRVVLGSVEGPGEIVRAMARSYPLHMKPGVLEVEEPRPGELIVRLRDVHTFVDSHHVGVFEGVLRYAEVADPQVTICSYSATNADLRLTFRARD